MAQPSSPPSPDQGNCGATSRMMGQLGSADSLLPAITLTCCSILCVARLCITEQPVRSPCVCLSLLNGTLPRVLGLAERACRADTLACFRQGIRCVLHYKGQRA